MFEQELFNYISANFADTLPLVWANVSIHFGEAEESTKTPYIVMYPLNNDGTKQVLCNENDYTDGETSIQFNIYTVNYSNSLYIGRQLDIFLSKIDILENYRVLLNNHEVTRGFPDLTTGLSLETVTRRFTYNKIGDN